jgi:hypothetical protein
VNNTLFGLTEAEVTTYGMAFGISALMLYMVFIVAQLAWKSKAGKFGTFVMFLALGLGLMGFLLKYVIQWILERP